MDTIRPGLIIVLLAVAAVLALELFFRLVFPPGYIDPLLYLGILRLLEIAVLIFMARRSKDDYSMIGLQKGGTGAGIRSGLIWAAGFGLLVAAAGGILWTQGHDPFRYLRINLPTDKPGLVLYFIVGGLVSPVAEEMFFRGFIYSFLRRWGWLTALIGSTLIFIQAHAPGLQVPVNQLVGGILFALAFEKTKNLLTPIVLHVLGNLAIFTIAALI